MAKKRRRTTLAAPAEQGTEPDEQTNGPSRARGRSGKVRAGVPQRSAWDRVPTRYQHLICLAALLAVTLGFFASVTVGGKTLVGGDTVQWRGMAESVIDYEATTGREALWAPNAFGGMPAYMIHYPMQVPQLDSVLRWLRGLGLWPAAYFFALLLGTYFLLYYLVRDTLAGMLAAVAFGLTTYIPLILLAGPQLEVHRALARAVAAPRLRLRDAATARRDVAADGCSAACSSPSPSR